MGNRAWHLGHDSDVEHRCASIAPPALPPHSTDSPAAGEWGPGRFGVTHRVDGDTLPFGSLPRPPRSDIVPGNLARLLHPRSQGKRARTRQAGLRLHRVDWERHRWQDHPVLGAGGMMTTARKLGAVAMITVAVVLTGCTTSTVPTTTSTTAPLRKAPPAIVVAVDTAATPRRLGARRFRSCANIRARNLVVRQPDRRLVPGQADSRSRARR